MIPLLDVLQSIPVLSFLPGVMLAMVALFPGRQLGVELGAILLIFTGQVWNMAFSFYASLKSIPKDMREAAAIYRFSWWQRFTEMELPLSAIGLVWNSMMSVAGGMVRADGLRNVRAGAARFSSARSGFVSANGGQCRRHAFDLVGHRHHGRSDRAAGSVCLAARDCVGREVQSGDSGKQRCSTVMGAEPGGALQWTGENSRENTQAAGGTPAFVFCPEAC